MIKAKITGATGRELVLLGLSEMNIDKLKEDQPILIIGEDIKLPGIDVMIAYGQTEVAITRQWEAHGLLPPGTSQKAGYENPPPAPDEIQTP